MTQQAVRYLPEEQLIEKALQALIEALGPMEATRFLSLAREGRLESVARHRAWQDKLEPKEFLYDVFGSG